MLDVTQAFHTHDAIAEAAMLMKEAVDDIMVTLNEAASEVGMVGGMVESITEAMAKVRTKTLVYVRHADGFFEMSAAKSASRPLLVWWLYYSQMYFIFK